MARFVRSCKPMLESAMANLSLTFAPCPDELPPLGAWQAHVWQIDLDETRASLLSLDEQARANAMNHQEKRAHFVAARSALRWILSKYTGVAPSALPIIISAGGKPALDGDGALHFNVTHAQGTALIAVSRVPVGIDLEFPRPLNQLDKLVENYFAPDEQRILATMAGDEKRQAFLAAWTRKEACLKATGEGIVGGLHRYHVTLRSSDEAQLIAIDGDQEKARCWCLHAFSVFGDGQAAICAQSETLNVTGFTL